MPEPNFEREPENIEGEVEKFPTSDEIFELLGLESENISVVQEKSDEKGIYRLDFNDGDTEYMYTREGKFDGSHESLETDIYMTTPTTYPDNIYRYKGGKWKKLG